MKPGRNDPCPCGSGKKYKKCCYLKDQSAAAEDSSRPETFQDYKDDDLSAQELILKALNNLRGYALNRKTHIAEYHKIRKLHGEIASAMIQHYYDGRFKQKLDTGDGSQGNQGHTLHLLESEFDLETQNGANAFYDMLIYKSAPNTSSITEAFS